MSIRLNAEAIFSRFTSKAKLKHMLLLVKLFELGSMKRTAEAMNISQPAVSLMVNELESLLNLELFYRHARGVVPTPVTKDLVPVARRIIGAIRDGSEIISSSVNDREGYVRIAATPAAICGVIQPKASSLVEHFGRTLIDINEITAADSLKPVTENSCDLLCIRQPNVIPEGWEFHPVVPDSLITVCGAKHALAQETDVTPEVIRHQRWLVSRGGSIAKGAFDELIEKYGLDETKFCSIITHTPALTIDLLKQNLMLAYIPRTVATPWLSSGEIIELPKPEPMAIDDIGIMIRSTSNANVTLAVFELLCGQPDPDI